jgi:hypothetical protein
MSRLVLTFLAIQAGGLIMAIGLMFIAEAIL